MGHSAQSSPPEHILSLRTALARAPDGERRRPAWMLAHALAAWVLSLGDDHPGPAALADEGLLALEQVGDAVPEDAREVVGSILRWRACVGDRREAAAARAVEQAIAAPDLPLQVRALVERARELLPAAVAPVPAPWVGFGGEVSGGPPLDMVAVRTALRSARQQADGLDPGDPRRARLMAVGALDPVLTALGTQTWSPREDQLVDEAWRLVVQTGEVDDPGTVLERIVVLTLRAARCLAASVGATTPRPGEVEELCVELDRLAEAHRLFEATGPDGGPSAQVRQLVPMLGGIAGFLHYQRASTLADGASSEDFEAALQRAEQFVQWVPAEAGDRMRLAGTMLRQLRASTFEGTAVTIPPEVAGIHPDFVESLGMAYSEVVALGNQALISGDLAALAHAVQAAEDLLVHLAPGHPSAAELQGLVCQLLTRRVTVTTSPRDLPLALDAGVRAARLSRELGGDASGPSVYAVGPLVNALTMAATMDLRTGPFAQAREQCEAILAGFEVDPDLQVVLHVGAGAAGLLEWRSSGDAAGLSAARARLETAERLVVSRRAATMDWLRSVFQLFQLHSSMATLWNDPVAAAAALRLLSPIEQLLVEHPELATQAQAMLVPGSLSTMGVAESGSGFRTALGALRSSLELLARRAPSSAVPEAAAPAAPAAESAAPQRDRDTAEALLAGRPGGAPDLSALWDRAAAMSGTDIGQLRQMVAMVKTNPAMRRQLEVMLGPQAELLDLFLRLADQMPDAAPPRPQPSAPPQARPAPHRQTATSDADRLDRVERAIARARSLLPADAEVLNEPLSDRAALEAAVTELATEVEGGVPDVELRGRGRVVLALGRARLAWFAEPFRDAALVGLLADLNHLLADRGREPSRQRVHVLDVLARCRRRVRSAGSEHGPAALAAARAALRELGRVVMAEESLEKRLGIAAAAEPIVRRAVAWAIADDCPDEALMLVERGRTLALAAVLLSSQVADLAARTSDPANPADPASPGDQERSVAEAFADVSATADGQVLLLGPSLEQLAMALPTTDLDALVYLVPPAPESASDQHAIVPDGLATGFALILRPAHDRVGVVPLTLVTRRHDEVMTRYRQAQQAFLQADPRQADVHHRADQARQLALDELGAWLHQNVIEPLLEHTAGWGLRREPRLGLVSVAEWAALPFAAAWRADATLPGGKRYAVHDLVLTHVPSGRAFLRAAAVDAVPIDEDVLVVVDPAQSGLAFSRAFGREVTSIFPRATVVARHAGTRQRILDALPSPTRPGASLVHLATHGRTSPEVAIQAADGWLPLSRILDQARGIRPGRPGGVVIVNACVTDVMGSTAADDEAPALDEALTVATSMLAAGAKHVIGTRWPVPDGCAAVLGLHLHRHLSRGLSPALALREAQLDLVEGTSATAIDAGPLSRVDAALLAAPHMWSGYTHQGA